ncbi:hypothetical protein BC939DRAFT_482324 [Gamsiella multidivaricata]|uniref:uncharacterized protein n=1 Tax=Gamsiella multidivaricata TaxID=101098 RepID=UPI00221E37FA|nr:uncharacterized protein BC939DRAFT_482324 [Gamsiella multidivaricata]KAI7816076.1 hypothetical protein BC939DRAFT_482324 [Gamsiella multidivaricata]
MALVLDYSSTYTAVWRWVVVPLTEADLVGSQFVVDISLPDGSGIMGDFSLRKPFPSGFCAVATCGWKWLLEEGSEVFRGGSSESRIPCDQPVEAWQKFGASKNKA